MTVMRSFGEALQVSLFSRNQPFFAKRYFIPASSSLRVQNQPAPRRTTRWMRCSRRPRRARSSRGTSTIASSPRSFSSEKCCAPRSEEGKTIASGERRRAATASFSRPGLKARRLGRAKEECLRYRRGRVTHRHPKLRKAVGLPARCGHGRAFGSRPARQRHIGSGPVCESLRRGGGVEEAGRAGAVTATATVSRRLGLHGFGSGRLGGLVP